jgi:predicted Zn-dependent peptidase
MQLIQRYFSTIPMRATPPSVDLGNLPKIQNTVLEVENPMASSPGFYLGYQLAPRESEDHYRLTITEYALLKGRTSRLFKRLFEKDKTAISMSGGIETRRGQSVFKIFVKANNEIMNERNQRAVIAEINKIKSAYITEEELEKIQNMFKMDYLKQFSTVLDKAIFLTEEFLDRGNHTQWIEELDRYLAVTHFNVSRVANIYFKEDKVLLKIKTK